METCPVVEELLQRLMDCGQLEVFIGGKEEPQICMQSKEKKVPLTPKALYVLLGKGPAPHPYTCGRRPSQRHLHIKVIRPFRGSIPLPRPAKELQPKLTPYQLR